MPHILSIGTSNPPYEIGQNEAMAFARELFKHDYKDIDRLLTVFQTGQIERRFFSAPLTWFSKPRGFQEKNDLYCQIALDIGSQAIARCLNNNSFFSEPVPAKEIDAFIFITSTGLSTPSLDATIMNRMGFARHTRRIPIWGLGCAGGTAGLARADDFCRAYPDSAVLVLSIELCSLTFQYSDRSKSNLVGTSLFADGAACALVTGDQSPLLKKTRKESSPYIMGSESTLMPDSEDVMGWDVRDEGLYVVFSKSIPAVVSEWFKPVAKDFLKKFNLEARELANFIAHPGGKKVLDAFQTALELPDYLMTDAAEILRLFGNMSSPTVLYVLDRAMAQEKKPGEYGLAVSLGPGFTSELLMMEWRALS